MPGFYNLLDAFFPAQTGQVAAGATTTSIPVAGKTYIPSAWKGGYMYFVNGAAQGKFASIQDNTATVFTVSGLTVAPGAGDVFVLFLGSQVDAASATDYKTQVFDVTIPAGQLRFLASGEEFAYRDVTVNGTYRVNGSLYCNNLTIGAGGVVIVAPGGETITGAFV